MHTHVFSLFLSLWHSLSLTLSLSLFLSLFLSPLPPSLSFPQLSFCIFFSPILTQGVDAHPANEVAGIYGFVEKSTLRGDTVAQTKATLKSVRTRVKRVLVYSKIENAVLCWLPWTQVANCISKGTIFCSYVPTTALFTTNYRVLP